MTSYGHSPLLSIIVKRFPDVVFQLVPANKKVELRDYMKVHSLGATFQSNRIAEAKFIQLKNFVKNMHIDQFSKVGDTNVEDTWQQVEFLKGLK